MFRRICRMNSSRVPRSHTPHSQKGSVLLLVLAVVLILGTALGITLLNRSGSSFSSPIAASPHLYEAQIVSNAPSPITFVQSIGNNAGYSPTAKTLALAFPGTNAAGNLILLSVHWGNTGIHVSSITDTRGNAYTDITGQVRYGTSWVQSNQLYYAKNIPAGVNTITLTMTGIPTAVFEARAYEYAGLDTASPLDQFSSATGTNATKVNPVAGSGFTGRPITNAGNTLGEDKVVASTGAYNATETIGSKTINSGSKTTTNASELIFGLGNYNFKQGTPDWFMSMVTFKAAAPSPTPTPLPPPSTSSIPSLLPVPSP